MTKLFLRSSAGAAALGLTLFFTSVFLVSSPRDARAEGAPVCEAPSRLARLDQTLWRVAMHVADRQPLKIVAIGSSSTAGAGASAPELSYPARLAVELRQLLPQIPITVVNRGINGQEVPDMVARFAEDVLAEKPDLVIWQFGTNALLRDTPLEEQEGQIAAAVRSLRAAAIDVVLLDHQYAPRVLAKGGAEQKVEWMSKIARKMQVGVFHRFAVMQHWSHDRGLGFDQFVTPDGLHMNDWGYGCVAHLMASAIADAAMRGPAVAHAPVAVVQ